MNLDVAGGLHGNHDVEIGVAKHTGDASGLTADGDAKRIVGLKIAAVLVEMNHLSRTGGSGSQAKRALATTGELAGHGER